MNEFITSLGAIAHARSGDKGNHANIAVFAYTPAGFRWLHEHLTAELVQNYFGNLKPTRVVRYESANVLGLNFVLYGVLAGGASQSLRSDSQGKNLGLALLHMEIRPGLRHCDAMKRPGPKGKPKGFKEGINAMMNLLGAPPPKKPRKKHG